MTSSRTRPDSTQQPRPAGFVQPHRWPRRHLAASTALTLFVALAVAAGTLAIWHPWRKCGPGLTAVGSPHICVGLNLEGTAFQDRDPVADLTRTIAAENATITGSYATVVLMENMTPNQDADSAGVDSLRHDIEGTLTAVRRANDGTVAGAATKPRIKLLLANLGSNGAYGAQSVREIRSAAAAQHIAAVTGIGVSQNMTRAAVAELAAEPSIAVVGSVVTADDMNTAPNGSTLSNFARVAPTNSDEVRAAATYIKTFPHPKILLIKDTNPRDGYAQTLALAFTSLSGIRPTFSESYESPQSALPATTRAQAVAGQFHQMHSDICLDHPDVIYFAGRGVDLASFLTAMAQGGTCGLQPATLVTGDDASNLAGRRLAYSEIVNRVIFTGLAFPDQWSQPPVGPTLSRAQEKELQIQRSDYDKFAHAFENGLNQNQTGFPATDLLDGTAMMNHDAALAAITAIRSAAEVTGVPVNVVASIHQLRCTKLLPGATGRIAIDSSGNPINKAMPLLSIQADGTLRQENLVWPSGEPLLPGDSCH